MDSKDLGEILKRDINGALDKGRVIIGIDLNSDEGKRIQAAFDLLEVYHSIARLDDGSYRVMSQHSPNKFYEVSRDLKTCSCPDFVYRQIQCKHILAVKIAEGRSS